MRSLSNRRTVTIAQQERRVHFFGMKGDLKWLAQVFKLPKPHLSGFAL